MLKVIKTADAVPYISEALGTRPSLGFLGLKTGGLLLFVCVVGNVFFFPFNGGGRIFGKRIFPPIPYPGRSSKISLTSRGSPFTILIRLFLSL